MRQTLQRRQFERSQADLPVTYAITGIDGSHDGRLMSLSGGGVRISGAEDLVQGSEINLRFCLPGNQREICTYGRIVMSFYEGATRRYSHGVAFTRIARSDQDAIVNHVDNVLLGNLRFLRAVDVKASGATSTL
ncbi:MAG: PilZ domain-containing protein [Candidatus Eremiobacteraeota bacterium]|nr:PilZ domain-containing protein [Candidatus Eremiobacteraeota bacterium]